METAYKNNNSTATRSPYSISCYFKMAPSFYSDGMKDDIRLALDRWGLKDRCRRITISAAAISHNQCQYWWTSMRVGWRLTLYHGRKKESKSQYSQAASTTKRYHTSKQVGFEPDPLDSFVIENTCDITSGGWSVLLLYLSLIELCDILTNFLLKSLFHSKYKKINKQINPWLSYILGLQPNYIRIVIFDLISSYNAHHMCHLLHKSLKSC